MPPLPTPFEPEPSGAPSPLNESNPLYAHFMTDLYKAHVHPESDINHKLASKHFLSEALKQLAPQDPTESMLFAQMMTCHNLMMKLAQRMALCQQFEAEERLLKQFNKLQQTFNDQVRTLEKYRNHGRQVVQVQHIQVGHGGQALIGQQAG